MSKVYQNKAKDFLKQFGSKIVCHSTGDGKKSAMRVASLSDAFKENAENNRDVYFYVNDGGTKKTDITHIRACFVDLDAGRDSNSKYLSDKEVLKKKVAMQVKIKACPLKPTTVVETRNGYHLYWIFYTPIQGSKAAQWQIVQNKIANHFKSVGADGLAQKINQLMRVPYTTWNKPHEGIVNKTLSTVTKFGSNVKYQFSGVAFAFRNESSNKVRNSQSFGKKYQPVKQSAAKKELSKLAKAYDKVAENQVINTGITGPIIAANNIKSDIEWLNDASLLLKEVAKLIQWNNAFTAKQCQVYSEKLATLYSQS